MTRSISRGLLTAEACLLGLLSAFGVPMFIGIIFGTDAGMTLTIKAATFLALICFIAGWRLLLTFLQHGADAARAVHKAWWRIAGLGATVSIASFALAAFDSPSLSDEASIFVFGCYFAFTFIHLASEVWLRAR